MDIAQFELFRLALVQRNLHECLTYFLYVSQAGTHRPYFGAGNKLTSDNLSALNGLCDRLWGESIAPGELWRNQVSPFQYAEVLARAYRLWEKHRRLSGIHPVRLPTGRGYVEWFRSGGSKKKYWPVHELRSWLLQNAEKYFRHVFLHGSVGTLDDVNGFSDLDLAVIIKTEILMRVDSLLELREMARQILMFSYAFDPLMHHGPYYLTELDFSIYPQGLLPLVVYENGVSLYGDDKPSFVCPYDSAFFTDSLMAYFRSSIERWSKIEEYIEDGWDVEVVLGTCMLLPTLYLQRITKEFRYKRDTFAEAKSHFTEDQWHPIETASAIRCSLPARYRPSRLLVNVAGLTGNPGLLVRKALWHRKSRQAVEHTRQRVGKRFAGQTSRLIESMLSKIAEVDAAKDRHPEDFLCALADINTGPFTDEPFSASMADYQAAKHYLLDRWTQYDPRPVAIYELGSVGAPGHSDLDFVVIWPEGQRIAYHDYLPNEYPESIRPYMVHPPYFCTASLWEKLAGWFPAFRLKHLWGDCLQMPAVPDSAKKGLALGHLAASLHTKLPEDLFLYAMQKPIRLRVIINTLHSFKYTCQLAATADLTIPREILELVREVEALRENWIDSVPKPFSELQQLCAKVCCALQVVHDRCIQAVDTSCEAKENDDNINHWFHSLSAYARQATCSYYTTGSIPRLVTPGLGRFLALCAVLEPRLLRFLADFEPLPRVLVKESIYTDGLRIFIANSLEYADAMIPLGVPATKYYSLGYSPEQTVTDDGVRLHRAPRLLHFAKKTISKTRGALSISRAVRVATDPNIVHKLRARLNYIRNYCCLSPRFRLFRLINPKKPVIAISLLMHMGDILACEPVAPQLYQKYSGAYIIWCVDMRYRELVSSNPYIRTTLGIMCMSEWIKWRDSGLFDLVIDLNVHERCCSRCDVRLYKQGIGQRIRGGDQYHYASLLEAFSKGAGIEVQPDGPKLYYPKRIVEKVDSLSLPSFFVSIHCKSNEDSRDVPREKWIKIVRFLCDDLQIQVIEVGSVTFASIDSPHYVDYCGRLTFLETAEVIRRSALFVGIDSGPAHLANAVKTPAVLLMGGYLEYARYMPYTGFYTKPENVDILWADGPASMLNVTTVLEALKKRLEKERM